NFLIVFFFKFFILSTLFIILLPVLLYLDIVLYARLSNRSNIRKYNINNEFVEGENNKIKSYGIKKFDNLKNFIILRIS
ncbi:hypothetical protein, partial [Leptotrichia sp. oral taxon 879]|uniref:hypothetical protein n=1 Tax=Leptotrichia sp. oral taxon 879 TaxID=1227267 RepID=UPI001E4599E5